MSRGWSLTLFAATALLGCGDQHTSSRPAVATVDGVRVVSNARLEIEAPAVVLGPPEVSIGGGLASELGEVVGASMLSDGRYVVGDGAALSIRFYDPGGAELAAVGREGDGPGEFRLIQGLGVMPGDTVWVYDFSLRRLTFVSPDAHVVREVPLSPPVAAGVVVGRDRDGTFLMAESWSSARVAAASSAGLNREPVAYLRYSEAGALLDTIGLFPGREVVLRSEAGRSVMEAAPLGRSAVHAIGGGRLYVGDQVGYEVAAYSSDGSLTMRIGWEGSDLDDTGLEGEQWREDRLAGVAPEDRPNASRQAEAVDMPDRKPAYGNLLATSDGSIWIGQYVVGARVPGRWEIFGPDGVWRGSAVMPPGFRPLQVGEDWVLGVSRDELGIEQVQLREVLPRS